MEAVCSFDPLANFYLTTRSHMAEDGRTVLLLLRTNILAGKYGMHVSLFLSLMMSCIDFAIDSE
jgi:hypothetical protein